MDNLAINADITESLLKLRLENISLSSRRKREKTRDYKPLVSNKEIEQYRYKLLQSRHGQAKYNVPVEVELGDNFLEETPDLEEELGEEKKQEIENLKNSISNQILEQDEAYETDSNLLKKIKNSIDNVFSSIRNINKQIDKLVNENKDNDPNQVVEFYLNELDKNISPYDIERLTDFYINDPYNFFDKFLRAINHKILNDYINAYFKIIDPDNELEMQANEDYFYQGQFIDDDEGFIVFPKMEEINDLSYDIVLNEYKDEEDKLLKKYKDISIEKTNEYRSLNYSLQDNERREKDNKSKIFNTNKNNKEKLDSYSNMLNFLNANQLNIQRLPNETDNDFLERLKEVSDTLYDDEYIETYASMETLDELKNNLKKIIKDNSLIEDVIKEITETGLRFEINKNFEKIKNNFIKSYGVNNKNLSSDDIKNYLLNQLKNINVSSENILNIEDEIDNNNLSSLILNPNIINLNEIINSGDKFENDQIYGFNDFNMSKDTDENLLMILNIKNLKALYLKIDPKGEIFISVDSGLEGSFNRVYFTNNQNNKNPTETNNRWTKYLEYISLDEKFNKDDTDLLNSILPRTNTLKTKKTIFNFLKNKVGLLESKSYRKEQKADSTFETAIGMGINTPYDIPDKLVKYGNIHINLHKLYYKNVLSIKDKNNKYIQNFKSTPISDELVNYLIKIFYKEPINDTDYKKLKKSELELLDQLNYVAGFGKQKNINKNEYVDNLKNELEIITGAIMAGNNNDKVLEELKQVLNKLVSYDAISLQSSKKYLNQFKPYL